MNMAVKSAFGHKGKEVTVSRKKFAQLGAQWFVLLARYKYRDKIKKDEMNRTCDAYGGEKYIGFLLGSKKERNNLQELDTDGSHWNLSYRSRREICWIRLVQKADK